MRRTARKRHGNVLVLVAFFLVGLMAVVAFAVDYGYLLVIRTDLQRAADAAALAAVRDLEPNAFGGQTGAEDAARATARQYANLNVRNSESGLASLAIPDADIVVGRYDRATVNSGTVSFEANPTLLDTVRVTLRRDGDTNPAVALFFGRVVGIGAANLQVSATAALRTSKVLLPGHPLLPIAVDETEWNSMSLGDPISIYGDGKVLDGQGNLVPGNWGTVNVGAAANSSSDLADQIDNGLRQADLDALNASTGPYGEPRIPTTTEVPPNTWVQGETGLSAGLQHAIERAVGEVRVVPIVDRMAGGSGNTSEYHIIRWGIVQVTDVQLHGAQSKKHVTIQKRTIYNNALRPNPDLSETADAIDGAFSAAGLVE